MNKEISIIIPTYQRSRQLDQILKSLCSQLIPENKVEVIICDSFSKDGSEELIKKKYVNNKKVNLKYININENVLSAKRNIGIRNSSFNYLILIDDDCIPDKDFIKNYCLDFDVSDKKTILSGVVKYPIDNIKKSNYLKFRSNTHFQENNIHPNSEIEPQYIVAMNMGFFKSEEILNTHLFNENFIGYGFEDYEFGYRLKRLGFSLKQTKAIIIHDEGDPKFKLYLKKYFHLGRDGMKNLLSINHDAAVETIYYRVENHSLFKLIVSIPKIYILLNIIEKIIITIEKSKLFLPFLYNLARLSSYAKGYIFRGKKNLESKNLDWYD
jgi:glycosyltransferase involved in cell wall biosynthesis|tara:strand:+ start:5850 stop:6824 length:975 start_codon:yes stop_codon:yes gene_type:complete